MRLLQHQIPEQQAVNSAKPSMQHAREGGKEKKIPTYIPLNWLNVNETQSRLKNLILVCMNIFLPLLEMFRRVTRLYHGVKMEIDLVKPG